MACLVAYGLAAMACCFDNAHSHWGENARLHPPQASEFKRQFIEFLVHHIRFIETKKVLLAENAGG